MNGTSALTSGLFGLNLPPGSEILVPSLDPWFGILPMRFFGLVPVFVDNHPRTLNFDLEDAKRRLTKNTRAIEVVHLFGLPCDMEAICDFAKEKGLLILEDCAHAHNASINGKYVGNWGQIGAFSCQGSKVLPAIEGGMANYENREYYERAASFGHYECPGTFPSDSKYRKYSATGLGLKLRIHPMGAALARCQLKTLDQQTEMERQQTHSLNSRLCQLPGISEQAPGPGVKRVYWSRNQLFIDPAKAGMSREVVGQGPEGRGRGDRQPELLGQSPRCGVQRTGVVAPSAGDPRSASRPGRSPAHGRFAPPLHQAGAGTDRSVRRGLREGLGASRRAGQELIRRVSRGPA